MKKHGGKRKGSGRKNYYGEPTKTISFRVPISIIEDIKKYVDKMKFKVIFIDTLKECDGKK